MNSPLHKFFVLIGFIDSPTFTSTFSMEEYSHMIENIFK